MYYYYAIDRECDSSGNVLGYFLCNESETKYFEINELKSLISSNVLNVSNLVLTSDNKLRYVKTDLVVNEEKLFMMYICGRINLNPFDGDIILIMVKRLYSVINRKKYSNADRHFIKHLLYVIRFYFDYMEDIKVWFLGFDFNKTLEFNKLKNHVDFHKNNKDIYNNLNFILSDDKNYDRVSELLKYFLGNMERTPSPVIYNYLIPIIEDLFNLGLEKDITDSLSLLSILYESLKYYNYTIVGGQLYHLFLTIILNEYTKALSINNFMPIFSDYLYSRTKDILEIFAVRERQFKEYENKLKKYKNNFESYMYYYGKPIQNLLSSLILNNESMMKSNYTYDEILNMSVKHINEFNTYFKNALEVYDEKKGKNLSRVFELANEITSMSPIADNFSTLAVASSVLVSFSDFISNQMDKSLGRIYNDSAYKFLCSYRELDSTDKDFIYYIFDRSEYWEWSNKNNIVCLSNTLKRKFNKNYDNELYKFRTSEGLLPMLLLYTDRYLVRQEWEKKMALSPYDEIKFRIAWFAAYYIMYHYINKDLPIFYIENGSLSFKIFCDILEKVNIEPLDVKPYSYKKYSEEFKKFLDKYQWNIKDLDIDMNEIIVESL